MLTLTLSPNRIRTHDHAPNPNRPTIDICYSIDGDIDRIHNFNNNLGPEFGG